MSRLTAFKILRREHLMLPHVGGNNCLVLRQLIEFFDHVLRFNRFIVLLVSERMSLLPFRDLSDPRRAQGFDLRRIAVQRAQNDIELAQNGFHVADDGDMRMEGLLDRCRVDIDMNHARLRTKFRELAGNAIVKTRAHGNQ